MLPCLGPLAPGFDHTRVRLHHRGSPAAACITRLSRGRAVALGNDLFFPPAHPIDDATLLHELAHAAQYQRWGARRYYRLALLDRLREVGCRLGLCASPYAYAAEAMLAQDSMEAQAQRIEDAFRRDRAATRAAAPR